MNNNKIKSIKEITNIKTSKQQNNIQTKTFVNLNAIPKIPSRHPVYKKTSRGLFYSNSNEVKKDAAALRFLHGPDCALSVKKMKY